MAAPEAALRQAGQITGQLRWPSPISAIACWPLRTTWPGVPKEVERHLFLEAVSLKILIITCAAQIRQVRDANSIQEGKDDSRQCLSSVVCSPSSLVRRFSSVVPSPSSAPLIVRYPDTHILITWYPDNHPILSGPSWSAFSLCLCAFVPFGLVSCRKFFQKIRGFPLDF